MSQGFMWGPRSSRRPLCLSSSRQASGSLGMKGLRSFHQTLVRRCSGHRGRPGALMVGMASAAAQ